ncbi:hypothetical protein [Acrocarpospora sp. B8E8]|uniref:hypothetical protein n=1 Tax=Acrocarpospora sp. B8E8 TaxID=3153572 RepID=UPI00325D917B
MASTARTWIARVHAAPDRGSSTLETIVIAALIFAAALGAVGAIIAAITRFQGNLG